MMIQGRMKWGFLLRLLVAAVLLVRVNVLKATVSAEAFPEISSPRALTSGPHDHFLASYFAINVWSKDLRYVAVLETDINGRLAMRDGR